MSDIFELPDLVSERVGGAVIAANDEFFAPKENLIKESEALWIADKYTERGKWMDGWESQRRREPGHDWAILRLGMPGVIHGVVVDTSYFRGNFPDSCSIEVCDVPDGAERALLAGGDVGWREILPVSKLQGHTKNRFVIDAKTRATHLRLHIYPDGGVARLRVHGVVAAAWDDIDFRGGWADLAAMENGGRVLSCSDEFFGKKEYLLMPGLARDMSEGWETRRRRGEGHDWVTVALGARGMIERVEIDTSHFIGNAPGWCVLDVCESDDEAARGGSAAWRTLLPRVRLTPNKRHVFTTELRAASEATHARLSIYPDGGVARLRLHGFTARSQDVRAAVEQLDGLGADEAQARFLSCCGSRAWAQAMVRARPFGDFAALARAADALWASLEPADILEAFSAHPRIGERKDGADQAARWARGEQSSMAHAGAAVAAELAEGNRAYEERFGYTFIVFATGKAARDMLDILRERLHADPAGELATAAEEQRKITRLRLRKLIASMIDTPEQSV